MPLKVTGYQIREALRRIESERKIAIEQSKDSLWHFKGEEGNTFEEVMNAYQQADYQISVLQVLQQYYNQTVLVDLRGSILPLALLVKMVGSWGRLEKMWREACSNKRGSYYEPEKQRDPTMIYASRTVPVKTAMLKANEASSLLTHIRQEIAKANATTLEITAVTFKWITTEELALILGLSNSDPV
jgi:hypothetical protein